MDRCAQRLSDSCASSLIRLVNISEKGSKNSINNLSFKNSLKYLILNDPYISIEIVSKNEFDVFQLSGGEIVSESPAIADAVLTDFILGANRVKNQHSAVMALKDSKAPSAWMVVSAYYCAFFSSIEICKLFDLISLGFDGGDIASLKGKASGPGFSDFFANPGRNFVGKKQAGKIRFCSVAEKPHAAAWKNLHNSIKHLMAKEDWPEIENYKRTINNKENSPSDIRNTWNYKRSDFFGEGGESRAKEFRKLIGNRDGACRWLKSNRAYLQESGDPSAIAALCEMLSSAVIAAADRAVVAMRQRD